MTLERLERLEFNQRTGIEDIIVEAIIDALGEKIYVSKINNGLSTNTNKCIENNGLNIKGDFDNIELNVINNLTTFTEKTYNSIKEHDKYFKIASYAEIASNVADITSLITASTGVGGIIAAATKLISLISKAINFGTNGYITFDATKSIIENINLTDQMINYIPTGEIKTSLNEIDNVTIYKKFINKIKFYNIVYSKEEFYSDLIIKELNKLLYDGENLFKDLKNSINNKKTNEILDGLDRILSHQIEFINETYIANGYLIGSVQNIQDLNINNAIFQNLNLISNTILTSTSLYLAVLSYFSEINSDNIKKTVLDIIDYVLKYEINFINSLINQINKSPKSNMPILIVKINNIERVGNNYKLLCSLNLIGNSNVNNIIIKFCAPEYISLSPQEVKFDLVGINDIKNFTINVKNKNNKQIKNVLISCFADAPNAINNYDFVYLDFFNNTNTSFFIFLFFIIFIIFFILIIILLKPLSKPYFLVNQDGILYPINSKNFIIGRDKSCNIIVNDKYASRRHTQIISDSGILKIIDLNSKNGTYLNNNKISSAILKDGDLIRIGKTIFRFYRKFK
ncbi:MAG: FHA domain-containing protein [Minisyncoccia bacterium]